MMVDFFYFFFPDIKKYIYGRLHFLCIDLVYGFVYSMLNSGFSALNLVFFVSFSGRRLTSQGTRDLDRIAGQVSPQSF